MASVSAMPSGSAIIDSTTVSNNSAINNYRINAVAELLIDHIRKGQRNNPAEFFHLCLSFSRGIDHAVANSELPTTCVDLPSLIKQICLHGSDLIFQGAIMVLMASVKNACRHGWFSNNDSVELHNLSIEISRNFCKEDDANTDMEKAFATVSIIMSRFYPRMKLGNVFASLDVKSGYGTYVVDFHISKETCCNLHEKICLFVAQVDDLETSLCLISPPQVNFLLNGRGIERRTVASVEPGPQIPTIVTPFLKYGTNVLQAVGQFTGQCLILVAFMSVKSSTDKTVLKDYVMPTSMDSNIDSEVIEGPSRISLKCPISYTRIKTPVKGHSCKHLQCFDFSNFVAINSRRPTWRCPHCNQPVCCTDVRLDRNMLKILSEVDENIADVIISMDRSWKPVSTRNYPLEKHEAATEIPEPEIISDSGDPDTILDLTVDDNDIYPTKNSEIVDRKPSLAEIQAPPAVNNLTTPELGGGPDQNTPIFGSGYWENMYLSNIGYVMPSAIAEIPLPATASQRPLTSNMPPPVPTDSVSFSINRESDIPQGLFHGSIPSQQQYGSNTSLAQQSNIVDPFLNNELGRILAVPRNVSRVPIAVQALPAQSLTPGGVSLLPRGPSTIVSLPSPSPAHVALSSENGSNIGFNTERQQQHQTSLLNTVPATDTIVSSLQPTFPMQVRNQQDLFTSGMTSPHISSLHGYPSLERAGSHGQTMNTARVSPHLSRTHSPHEGGPGHSAAGASLGSGGGVGRQTQFAPVSQHIHRHSVPPATHIHPPHPSHHFYGTADGVRAFPEQRVPNSTVNTAADVSADGIRIQQRPVGRMRGSLTGRAYSAALSQMMILPTHSGGVGGTIPVVNTSAPSSSTLAPQLQAYFAQNGNPLDQFYPVQDSSGLQWNSIPYHNS